MSLIEKYNRAAPRYTSYPAYPHWDNPPQTKEWIEELQGHARLSVDLYLHIPFCRSLCTYCGCTRTIKKDLDVGLEYTELLIEEWKLYTEKVPQISIESFHLGGGTPTFLKPDYLDYLLSSLLPKFDNDTVGATEIDPRVTTKEHIEVLKKFGVNRFSLGIQDFDPAVQRACNRIQPVPLVVDILNTLRKDSDVTINFDLIYGLPLQNLGSIERTIIEVKKMRPETIALYGYAHVPWKSKAQKSLEKYHIPQGEEKRELYEKSKELLERAGYREIGLDHFALKDDELNISYEKGSLKRNFMGYTTKIAPVTLGLGASAISSSKYSFVQNAKDINHYRDWVEWGRLPIEAGHKLSLRDQESSEVIQGIMCRNQANFSNLYALMNDSEKGQLLESLTVMEQDGLLELKNKEVIVKEKGRPFLRNICLPFDHRINSGKGTFSSTI